jgi:hypothetical protein
LKEKIERGLIRQQFVLVTSFDNMSLGYSQVPDPLSPEPT